MANTNVYTYGSHISDQGLVNETPNYQQTERRANQQRYMQATILSHSRVLASNASTVAIIAHRKVAAGDSSMPTAHRLSKAAAVDIYRQRNKYCIFSAAHSPSRLGGLQFEAGRMLQMLVAPVYEVRYFDSTTNRQTSLRLRKSRL